MRLGSTNIAPRDDHETIIMIQSLIAGRARESPDEFMISLDRGVVLVRSRTTCGIVQRRPVGAGHARRPRSRHEPRRQPRRGGR
jgi:hypothetical protein